MRCLLSGRLTLLCSAAILHGVEERFYLGTYTRPGGSEGIYTGIIDSESGRLGPMTLAAKAPNPGYVALAPGNQLPLCRGLGGGRLGRGLLGEKRWALDFLNRAPAAPGTCHVSVDPSGKNVFAANYSDGSITCIRTARMEASEKSARG